METSYCRSGSVPSSHVCPAHRPNSQVQCFQQCGIWSYFSDSVSLLFENTPKCSILYIVRIHITKSITENRVNSSYIYKIRVFKIKYIRICLIYATRYHIIYVIRNTFAKKDGGVKKVWKINMNS